MTVKEVATLINMLHFGQKKQWFFKRSFSVQRSDKVMAENDLNDKVFHYLLQFCCLFNYLVDNNR